MTIEEANRILNAMNPTRKPTKPAAKKIAVGKGKMKLVKLVARSEHKLK
jgi:hypothetical protein